MSEHVTILVIEDNPMNLELVTDLLTARGYTVLQAMSAEEGLQLARSRHPDLVLMDIALPHMDGLEATRRLRADARTADIPVLALTASVSRGDKEKCCEAGCNAVISKPIDTREFPSLIEACLSGSPKEGEAVEGG